MRTKYEKQCPNCGEEFKARRLNQKFCNIKCKATYHNAKTRQFNSEHESIVKDLHDVLWKNRELLRANIGREVNAKNLQHIGFEMRYMTHYETTKKKQNIYFCYDYAYQYVRDGVIKIIKP